MRASHSPLTRRFFAPLKSFHVGPPLALVYDYIEGPTLEEYLDEHGGYVEPQLAVAVVREILKGLGYLHTAGLFHCDLHTENIKIVSGPPNLVVVLLDLGLAWIATEKRGGHSKAATARFVAGHEFAEPEKRRHYQPPDAQTDLYSVGALLWRMLTGLQPFPRAQTLEQAWPTGSGELIAIIERACLVDRRLGFGDTAQMISALELWQQRDTEIPIGNPEVQRCAEIWSRWLGTEAGGVEAFITKQSETFYLRKAFAQGVIYWCRQRGAIPIFGAIFPYWEQHGGETGN